MTDGRKLRSAETVVEVDNNHAADRSRVGKGVLPDLELDLNWEAGELCESCEGFAGGGIDGFRDPSIVGAF